MPPTSGYQDVAARAVAALHSLLGPDAGIYPEEGYGAGCASRSFRPG
jgi:hypothetical protein